MEGEIWRTSASWRMYFDKATVTFTVHGGATAEEVAHDLDVVAGALTYSRDMGFTFEPPVVAAAGHFDDVRDAAHWVRGISRGGHDVVYLFSGSGNLNEKVATAYDRVIAHLPITPDDWEAAKVWESPTPPSKDVAMRGGYLRNLPGVVELGMKDSGKTFTLTDGRTVPIYKIDEVINSAPGGMFPHLLDSEDRGHVEAGADNDEDRGHAHDETEGHATNEHGVSLAAIEAVEDLAKVLNPKYPGKIRIGRKTVAPATVGSMVDLGQVADALKVRAGKRIGELAVKIGDALGVNDVGGVEEIVGQSLAEAGFSPGEFSGDWKAVPIKMVTAVLSDLETEALAVGDIGDVDEVEM